ncbi:MAG: HNH endonuclease signature motif containing protein, partial [Aeromicrobium sp.]
AEHVEQETEHPDRAHQPKPPTKPATLAGYGNIGPSLLMYFLCVSDVTAFLMKDHGGDRQAQILNVGRTHRLATLKQRRAVIARQHGVCAAPGCRHTHLEVHHSIWYSRGGTTDLDPLIGLCSRCHHLVHKNRLVITGNAVDGFDFTTRTGRPLARRRRSSYRRAA